MAFIFFGGETGAEEVFSSEGVLLFLCRKGEGVLRWPAHDMFRRALGTNFLLVGFWHWVP